MSSFKILNSYECEFNGEIFLIPFTSQFTMQNSSEIDYKGKKVNRFYTYDRKGTHILRFTFVSTNSVNEQGITFHLSRFKGEMYINDEKIKIRKSRFPQLMFDEKNTPKQFEVKVILEDGDITICNCCTHPNCPEIWDSLLEGCAMIIEKLGEDSFRFHCNDMENDDDFDDLIFDMQILSAD